MVDFKNRTRDAPYWGPGLLQCFVSLPHYRLERGDEASLEAGKTLLLLYVFLLTLSTWIGWDVYVCVCLRKRFRRDVGLSPFKMESGRRRGREMHEEGCIIPARISLVS